MNTIINKYQQRQANFTQKYEQLQAQYDRLAWIRLIAFVIMIALVVLAWQYIGFWSLLLAAAFLFGFYKFVQWHQHIQLEATHQQALAAINEEEAQVFHHEYSMFDNGKQYIDTQHPYTGDLDLFGAFSFFQYINRTVTANGHRRLAHYLQHPTDKKTILERQRAIKELSVLLDWRQHFQAYGRTINDSPQHTELLLNWLRTPAITLNNTWIKTLLWLSPILALVGGILWLYYLPWYLAILFFLPAALTLRNNLEAVNKIHQQTGHADKALQRYAQLIAQIENQTFESKKLKDLQAHFFQDNQAVASASIRQFAYILSQLNVRYNAFIILLNLAGIWDLQWVYRLEKWKETHSDNLPKWLEALPEMEALTSFANLYYNNPDWTFPIISEEAIFEAKAFGHPLILSSKRVTNDICIPTDGHIKLVTGSNMAGKSTFLRSVGLNIVLAMVGSPVCAASLQLPLLKVYTSMRTQDALHESTSSFYAELKRLKFIIEAVEKGENIFFLLDEILKGTNSKDRHTGSKALIQQLIKAKGAGIIATHDLELGALAANSDGAIENLCLEVEIKDRQLFFDYKLKKGVSQSFNATLLMQQMGIRV